MPAVLRVNQKRLDIDLAYRGSHIRDFKKKSYHIAFYSPKTFRRAKEIHLNAEYKDPSMMRNKLSLDFFAELGTLSPKANFVTLQINGRHEGCILSWSQWMNIFWRNGIWRTGLFFTRLMTTPISPSSVIWSGIRKHRSNLVMKRKRERKKTIYTCRT